MSLELLQKLIPLTAEGLSETTQYHQGWIPCARFKFLDVSGVNVRLLRQFLLAQSALRTQSSKIAAKCCEVIGNFIHFRMPQSILKTRNVTTPIMGVFLLPTKYRKFKTKLSCQDMTAIEAKGLNILVVDDEKSVTTTVSFVLQRSGYTVDVVHDGEDALSRLVKSPDHYQILITDNCMRKVSGLELVQRLQERDFQGRIVVLSGSLSLELEEAYRALGADKIMRKPFGIAELRKTIEELSPVPSY